MPLRQHQKATSVEPRATQEAEKLKIKDDSDAFPCTIRLASPTAARIAETLFKFLQQDGLILRVAAMSAGKIRSLCLLHSRLSRQKGKSLPFREALHYCLPKPLYVPAADIIAPSPADFVQQVRAEGADAALPDIPAPQVCMLCGAGKASWTRPRFGATAKLNITAWRKR